MLNLTEYRKKPQTLADFLPWAALVAPGVVLNKDGSFQRTARFRGPDLDSATPAELVAVSARLNTALRRLGSCWAVFAEAQRVPARSYPLSSFPDPVSDLVDAERRAQFEEEGSHFESRFFLTFTFLPPADEAARAEGWLYEGKDETSNPSGRDGREALAGFADMTGRILDLIEAFMPEARWLTDQETLTYLHSTISTRRQNVRVPEMPVYLDAILVDEPLIGGLAPKLGDEHLRVLTINGFPSATFPGILDDLNRLAFPYRCHRARASPHVVRRGARPRPASAFQRGFGRGDQGCRRAQGSARARGRRPVHDGRLGRNARGAGARRREDRRRALWRRI